MSRALPMPAKTATPSRRLRQLLTLDAVVSAGNGVAYLAMAGPLSTLLGVPAGLLAPLGGFLVAYGVAVAVVALRRDISRVAAQAIIVANILWVAASLLTLVVGPLSPTLIGGLWIAAQAVAVGAFAAAQSWALRRMI